MKGNGKEAERKPQVNQRKMKGTLFVKEHARRVKENSRKTKGR